MSLSQLLELNQYFMSAVSITYEHLKTRLKLRNICDDAGVMDGRRRFRAVPRSNQTKFVLFHFYFGFI